MVNMGLSLFNYEGTLRIALLLDQVNRNTSCGKGFMTCIEGMILESGMYESLWKMDIAVISKWVSRHSLIYAACEYNCDNKIDINLKHSTLEPKRHRDQSIMNLSSNLYSLKVDLSSINRVRYYHEIISISDICEAEGRTLSPVF